MSTSARNRGRDLDVNYQDRITRGEKLLSYGVDYLDDALFGISQSDVVLVGAESGAGKTQLVTNVALYNAARGVTIDYFALEADKEEIEERIIYQIFCTILKRDGKRFVDYQDFAHGKHNEPIADLEAQDTFKKTYPTLRTLYKNGDFTVDSFRVAYLRAVANGSNLCIVDHAHYFDWGDKNDNTGLREVVTTVRDMAIENKVPCLLVSHIRKPDYKTATLAPRLEDFHGSSELYKRATKAIMIAKGPYESTRGVGITYANAVKNRFNGAATNLTGQLIYNYKTGQYEKGYELGSSHTKRGKEFESISRANYPLWAKRSDASGDASALHRRDPTPIKESPRASNLQSLPYKD